MGADVLLNGRDESLESLSDNPNVQIQVVTSGDLAKIQHGRPEDGEAVRISVFELLREAGNQGPLETAGAGIEAEIHALAASSGLEAFVARRQRVGAD